MTSVVTAGDGWLVMVAACRMLSLTECSDKDTVFDLGCGDGRVVSVCRSGEIFEQLPAS